MSQENTQHDSEMSMEPQNTLIEDSRTQSNDGEVELAPQDVDRSSKPKRKPKEPGMIERELGKSFFPVSRVQKILKADKVRPPRVAA